MKEETEAYTKHSALIKEMEASLADKLAYGASIKYLSTKSLNANNDSQITPQSGPSGELKQSNSEA